MTALVMVTEPRGVRGGDSIMRFRDLCAFLACCCCFAAEKHFTGDNMNGEYLLAPTPGAPKAVNWSTSFKVW